VAVSATGTRLGHFPDRKTARSAVIGAAA
jgi:hypothetical protein